MSAIVGILFLDGRSVDRPVLGRMVDVLAHRGPDGRGVWSEGPVGLGHRMLWTTPESLKEELPLADKSGNFVLTADARLDNRDELIAALGTATGIAGHQREEIGDSELILAAYEKWGERCPEKLLGDFAFAVWDGRNQRLFCARDHMGVKPFYYFRSERALVFASEIKALFCIPEVPRRLNEARVADYLVPLLEDKTITFYQQILRLPPAHSITISRKSASTRRYWSLDPSREVRFGSDEEYAEAFREIFTEAVRCRLRSAFPVGSQLSGGLDSSSITCVARDLLLLEEEKEGGERRLLLRTFSAVFDEVPECDERYYIEKVLAGGGIESHEVKADQMSPLGDIERVLWHMDEPFMAPNLFLEWGLDSAAHQQGVRVVLSGIDGDTIVSWGYPYLIELARRGRWVTLAKEIDALSKRFGRSRRLVLKRKVLRPLAPDFLVRYWQRLRGLYRPGRSYDAGDVINPDFGRSVGLEERAKGLREPSIQARISREHHWRDINRGILAYNLELGDKVGGAFSMELRYPFLDRRLVEFCLALPPEQKLRRGWTRMVVRRALAGSLPEEIRWRIRKTNLGPNFDRGLLMFDRKLLEEVVLKNSQVIERYVDVDALHRMYYQHVFQGVVDNSHLVFAAVVLGLWLRRTGLGS